MKNITELNATTFDAAVSNDPGLVLVDFWAPWCGPCKMQLPILERVAERVQGLAKIAKVNVDEVPELAERFRITGIPTLLLFKQGKVVRELVGMQTEAALVAAMEAAR